MNTEANGLSLEGLASRLEALERENDELRSQVATLGGPETPPQKKADDQPPCELENSRVSRRQLLSKAGVAAVGSVAAGALLLRNPREANAETFGNVVCDSLISSGFVAANQEADACYRGGVVQHKAGLRRPALDRGDRA